jgi:hypothetical protein
LFVVSESQKVDLATHVHETYGFDISRYHADVLIVLLIGLIVRVIGCLLMWAADRNKKV